MHALELFDSTLFTIPTAEASSMDPQQRLLLEVGYASFHGAQLRRSCLERSETAVYVGVMNIEFAQVQHEGAPYAFTGIGHCFAAGRISYVLGLHGACEAIDTACSSALVALHESHRSMRLGEHDNALAAGVNAMIIPTI